MSADQTHDCGVRLLEGLEAAGAITATTRSMIQRFMTTWQVSAFHALLMTEVLSEAEVASALAEALSLPRLYHVRTMQIAEEALPVVTFRRAREWECLPLKGEGGKVELVLADPTRQDRIDEIRRGLKSEMTLSVGERSDIVRAIDELYPLSAQLPSLYTNRRSDG